MARVKKCRYGKLKAPKGRRICRKAPRKGAKGKCPHGKLKNPIGKRICKKRRGARRATSKAQQEALMWRQYRAG